MIVLYYHFRSKHVWISTHPNCLFLQVVPARKVSVVVVTTFWMRLTSALAMKLL